MVCGHFSEAFGGYSMVVSKTEYEYIIASSLQRREYSV